MLDGLLAVLAELPENKGAVIKKKKGSSDWVELFLQ